MYDVAYIRDYVTLLAKLSSDLHRTYLLIKWKALSTLQKLNFVKSKRPAKFVQVEEVWEMEKLY